MNRHNIIPRIITIASVLSSVVAIHGTVQAAPAKSATTTNFTTQIYISNPNASSATAVVNFYSQLNGTADAYSIPVSLNAYGSTTVLIGGLSAGFKGSSVISADQNVVAAAAQIPSESQTNRPMYSAFNSGTPSLYLSTFLANRLNQFSIFGVQNVESVGVNIRAKFIEDGSVIEDLTIPIPGNASKFFDSTQAASTISANFANYMNTHTGGFNGSVVVTATKQTDGSTANIVGVSQEENSDSGIALSFEAIPQSAGASTVFIPSALCGATSQVQTTFFAVQNMGQISASVTITYIDTTTGNVAGTETTTAIAPGGKASLNPCYLASGSTGTLPSNGFSGSAIVQSSQPLNAIAKKIATSAPAGNFKTAFIGQGTGGSKVAIPYARWGTNSGQNGDILSFFAIQNIGATAIPAGGIQIMFYSDSGGVPIMTCTSVNATNPNAKVNASRGLAYPTTNCSPAVANTAFSGNVVIQGPAGSNLAVIATSQMNGYSYESEDINGTVIP